MDLGIRRRLLPDVQRRTLDELTSELELRVGDTRSKLSAFWTMLTLSAIIASAGVLADSTATVIGAMIIAPLSTPIMGVALSLVKRQRNGSMIYVVSGALLVILIGMAFGAALPGVFDIQDNSQIAARTSPGLLDLVAAAATGLAGAVALARRDVAAVLPGVAIAISLVPPLAVVGVCAGQGDYGAALGALLLFLSNVLALVLAGTFVFAALGYSTEAVRGRQGSQRRAKVTLAVLITVVTLPLVLNTVATAFINVWTASVQKTASEWIASTPQATVTSVDVQGVDFVVHVQTTGELPPISDLMTDLQGKVPNGLSVEVVTTLGRRLDGGQVGGGF